VNAERLVEICLQVSGQQANSRSNPLDADGPHLFRLGLRIEGESYSGSWQQHLERVDPGGVGRHWHDRHDAAAKPLGGVVRPIVGLNPEHAMANRALLIDVARAGDFGTFASRDAARLAMLIAALDDDALSPLLAEG